MQADSTDPRLSGPQKSRLVDLDRRHVWHPFTQHALWNQVEPLIIVAAEGVHLIDADGRRYIDGVSSLWCNIHGHRQPEIDEAIRRQLDRVAHTTQLGLVSPPAVELAARLAALAPAGLQKVFFSDDGSTSVEVACKMAFGYWRHRRKTRRRFIALGQAYHGDTVGALSFGGIDLFRRTWQPLLFRTDFAPPPYCYRCPLGKSADTCGMACVGELERMLQSRRGQVAAVIIEPLIQCAGGMITAPAGYLRRVRELCDQYDTLLIADEVATGFGRTGRMFACEHEHVAPDLMCLSKGLTGGYLPLAATLATDQVYEAFLGPIDRGRTFYHGHTFTGNPLGCAAALASLDLFESAGVLERVSLRISLMAGHLRRISCGTHVGSVRQCGLMAGIEIVRNRATREAFPYARQVGARVCARARDHGVILRPLADVIVVMPPLSIASDELDDLMTAVERSIEEVVPAAAGGRVDGLE